MRSETAYVSFVAWARNAQNILEYCHRGCRLYCEGHLSNVSRSPEDHQFAVTLDSFQMVDLRSRTTGCADDGGSDTAGVADDVGDVGDVGDTVQGADAGEACKDVNRW